MGRKGGRGGGDKKDVEAGRRRQEGGRREKVGGNEKFSEEAVTER